MKTEKDVKKMCSRRGKLRAERCRQLRPDTCYTILDFNMEWLSHGWACWTMWH